jgi:hypothetical protein
MGGSATRTEVACCLTGSLSSKTLGAGHDRLSTYGLLRAMSQDEVLAWVDALVEGALLDLPLPGRVALSAAGVEVMSGRAPLPPLRGARGGASGSEPARGGAGASAVEPPRPRDPRTEAALP